MKANRILIVDDKEENLYLLRALLQGNGYEVAAAANGDEALKAARQNPPDLVVSDILMPVMDGFTLCREWKKDGRLRRIPFVFYTATYTDERDRKFALGLGADKFLVKPQEPEALMREIREVVRNVGSAPAASVSAGPAQKEETGYLKQYNEVLVHKLEQKMEQLEKANRELEQRVSERTAELLAANKELEAFSYSAAHDLRAPILAVDGYAHMLLEDYGPRLDDEGRRLCAAISESTRRMGNLISDLLNFSHIGRAVMQRLPVDMKPLVETIFLELTTPESRGRIDLSVGPLPTATGDAALLREVWTNLLGNAVKFTSKIDRARIEVNGRQEGGETVYSVRDNGAGFDMRHASKLFSVFERLHRHDEFEGTGVGLAIVQRIVMRHGGRVWAEGKANEGATFRFSLPKSNA
ncbi:MAG TPA: response regulator, partial [bacterium]|nr:response regulator [bacterium]